MDWIKNAVARLPNSRIRDQIEKLFTLTGGLIDNQKDQTRAHNDLAARVTALENRVAELGAVVGKLAEKTEPSAKARKRRAARTGEE